MENVMQRIQAFMEKLKIPGRDLYDLPTSDKAFADLDIWGCRCSFTAGNREKI